MRISDWSSDVCSSELRSGHRHLAIEFDTESPVDAAAASVAAGEECAADRLDRAGLRIADLHRHAITILIDYALECGSAAAGYHRVFIDRPLQDRSGERRVGKEGVRTVTHRWWA